MFVGDALFEDSDEPVSLKMGVFLVIYIGLIFMILLNFFLAIVVNHFTDVKLQSTDEEHADNNSFQDLWDCYFRLPRKQLTGQWPMAHHLRAYFEESGAGSSEKPVTAEELHRFVLKKNGKPAFGDMRHAQNFLKQYCRKVNKGGECTLQETRADLLYPPGAFFDPTAPPEEDSDQNNVSHEQVLSEFQKLVDGLGEMKTKIAEMPTSPSRLSQEFLSPARLSQEVAVANEWERNVDSSAQGAGLSNPGTTPMFGNQDSQDTQAQQVLSARLSESQVLEISQKAMQDAMTDAQVQELQAQLRLAETELMKARARLLFLESAPPPTQGFAGAPPPPPAAELAVVPVAQPPAQPQGQELVPADSGLEESARSAQYKLHYAQVEHEMLEKEAQRTRVQIAKLETATVLAKTATDGLHSELQDIKSRVKDLEKQVVDLEAKNAPRAGLRKLARSCT